MRLRPLVIDHEHYPNWKRLPPEIRKKYVRGLVCRFCNGKYLRRGVTWQLAERVKKYLQAYERRNVQSAK